MGTDRRRRRQPRRAGHADSLTLMPAAIVTLAVAVVVTATCASALGAGLPDGRAYELVSNSGSAGEPYAPPAASFLKANTTGVNNSERLFQAAEHGEAITYVAEPPLTGGSGETGPGEGNQWLATRTAGDWTATGITPQSNGEIQTFEAFGPDLETQIFEGGAQPVAVGVPVGCHDLYAREGAAGTYRALFVPAEGSECGRPLLAGTANRGADLIFQSEGALTKNAVGASELPPGHVRHNEYGAPIGEACMYGCNLYEATAGGLRLVNVAEGAPVPNAIFGGYPGRSGSGVANFSNAISSDGSRIFWTDTQPGPLFEHIYVLEDGSGTVQVSGAEAAEYWTATPDGRYAYYTEAGGLWRFNTESNTREAIEPGGSGVQAAIGTNQTGEDGAYVYFVAEGALAAGATTKVCRSYNLQEKKIEEEQEEHQITFEEAQAAENRLKEEIGEEEDGQVPPKTGCNLYLRHGATTTLVAVLAPEDNEVEVGSEDKVADRGGDWRAGLGLRTAEITPDGTHLLFESRHALTGYKNRPEGIKQLQLEGFVYAASGHTLTCVSCDPTGAPPNVTERESKGASRLPVSTSSATYTRRWISTDGSRVFFDSEQRLLTQDTNDVQDVYEWEREGTTGCPEATSKYGGCIFLISGGESQGYSFLVDADATGQNVFFEHQGPLGANDVPSGRNELYDARVDGGFPKALTACAGNGCQSETQSPATFATPASSTFSGIGNFAPPPPPKQKSAAQIRAERLSKALKACRRMHDKKRRTKCERQARRRYGPVHHAKGAGKANNDRRTHQ
jgi:hypothetical protein